MGVGSLNFQESTQCDRNFFNRLNGKFCRVVIRLAMLYGTECWSVKKTFEHKMNVTEMRMLRWMCAYTFLNRIKNQEFRKKVKGSPLFLQKCGKIG